MEDAKVEKVNSIHNILKKNGVLTGSRAFIPEKAGKESDYDYAIQINTFCKIMHKLRESSIKWNYTYLGGIRIEEDIKNKIPEINFFTVDNLECIRIVNSTLKNLEDNFDCLISKMGKKEYIKVYGLLRSTFNHNDAVLKRNK